MPVPGEQTSVLVSHRKGRLPAGVAISWCTLLLRGVLGAADTRPATDLLPAGVPAAAVRLVDRVRCHDPADPHPFDASDGASVQGFLGRPARVAGPLKFSWLRWRGLRIGEKGRTHLLAITYPEDRKRAALVCWPPGTGKTHLNTIYTRHRQVWRALVVPLYTGGGFPPDEWWIAFLNVGRGDTSGKGVPDPELTEMCQARCFWCLSGVSGSTLEDVAPPAVGEILVWEVLDERAVFPPLSIAHPVGRDEERFLGTSSQLSRGQVPFGRQQGQMSAAQAEWIYFDHLGINLIDAGDPQRWRLPEELFAACDRRGVRVFVQLTTGLGLDRYFALLPEAERTRELPQPVRALFEKEPGLWQKTEPLMYEVASRLGYGPWDWLNPEVAALFRKLVERNLLPLLAHPSVFAVKFDPAVGSSLEALERFEREVLEKPIPGETYRAKTAWLEESGERERFGAWIERKRYEVFAALVRDLRKKKADLHFYLPVRHYLRTFEHLGATTPYPYEAQRVPYREWAREVKGILGGVESAFYTRYSHEPPAGHPALHDQEVLRELARFEEGWVAAARTYESEIEGASSLGWLLDNLNLGGPEFRRSALEAMSRNPRYLFLNSRDLSDHVGDVRHLASIWRSFPWGRAADLSRFVRSRSPSGPATILRVRERFLLLNHAPEAAELEVSIPARGIAKELRDPRLTDAVTGAAVEVAARAGRLEFAVALEPSSGVTLVLAAAEGRLENLVDPEVPETRRAPDRPPATPFDRERTVSYLRSLQNPDGGFGYASGAPSHVGSTYASCAALRLLGARPRHGTECLVWLGACRNADGGYGHAPGAPGDLWYTAAGVLALESLGAVEALPEAARADTARFLEEHARGVLSIAMALEALRALGREPAARAELIAALRGAQRLPPKWEGAFGTTGDLPSARITALAVWALAALGSEPRARKAALAYLERCQRGDGGFGYGTPGWRSKVWNTALAVRALRAAGRSPPDRERLIEFLLSSYNPDGGFGPYPGARSMPLATLWALEALGALGWKGGGW